MIPGDAASRPPSDAARPTLAVLMDFREEGWASMDLAGEMLLKALTRQGALRADGLRARWRQRATRLPVVSGWRVAQNFDRYLNRMKDYPAFVRANADRFDLFHIVDHSYAHLSHDLPAGRVGVYCHDLDTFQCVLEPGANPRSGAFVQMTRRILDGFQRCELVFYSTDEIRSQILRYRLVDESRLIKAPPGVSPEFAPAVDVVPESGEGYLLHVGSCIPRKRVDVLLNAFAELRSSLPSIRLVQVGGTFSEAQLGLIERLGIRDCVQQVRGLSREELAEKYRGARLVIVPSDAEGFGLPVIEALACGTAVITSDIPVLREVAGDAGLTFAAGDARDLATKMRAALHEPHRLPPIERRLRQAGKFSWNHHARIIADAYHSLWQRDLELHAGGKRS